MEVEVPAWLDADFLEACLRKDERDPHIQVLDFNVSPVVGKGDNYLSLMLRAHVEYTREAGGRFSRSLIVKSLPEGKFMQSIVQDFGAFLHETFFYQSTAPAMLNLLPRRFVARSFHSPRPNTLVLEDLKLQGFIMCNRRAQLDLKHCKLALRALARLHGTSVALFNKDPTFINVYKEKIFSEETREVANKIVNVSIKDMPRIISSWEGFERFGEKMENLVPTFTDRMIEMLKPRPGVFRVLNHGDLWTNNMLFRYSETSGEVVEVRMVDFQLSRFASPALDLIYFLYTSARPEVRIRCWDELLKEYHSCLCETLKELECEQDGLTYEALLEEMHFHRLYALVVSCTILTAVLAEPKDSYDLTTLTEEALLSGDVKPMEKAQTNPIYRENLEKLLLEFEKKDII